MKGDEGSGELSVHNPPNDKLHKNDGTSSSRQFVRCRNSHLSIENKVLLYTAVMHPILAYASPVWGYAAKTNINILGTLQNSLIQQPIGVTVHFTQQPIREQSLSSQSSQKLFQTHHPDEAPKPRLQDPIDQPIAVMPPSRKKNPTIATPHIEDLSRYGIEDCFYSPEAQKSNAYSTPIQVKWFPQSSRKVSS
ncbi:uncharacterized protein TNCV_3338511 [Trichonephila clavipes]|nr:uncharacterized protein TNCV_3338511 [Trichonephila clavipes]